MGFNFFFSQILLSLLAMGIVLHSESGIDYKFPNIKSWNNEKRTPAKQVLLFKAIKGCSQTSLRLECSFRINTNLYTYCLFFNKGIERDRIRCEMEHMRKVTLKNTTLFIESFQKVDEMRGFNFHNKKRMGDGLC